MASRLLAGGLLLASSGVAYLSITFWPVARAVQAAIVLSMVYVAYLAWKGWRVMRDAVDASRRETAPLELPSITIIVPARNEEHVIGGVVADLAAQALAGAPVCEVIVVDDGSTDATAERAARAAGPLADHFTLLRRAAGVGPTTKGAVLAFAMRHAHGEVIGALDADARVAPDFLARVMAAWQRDRAAAGIQAQRLPLNAERGWLTRAQRDEQLMDMASQCGRWVTDGTAELRGNGMFVRRAALERLGGWNPDALTEDLDLSTRLAVADEHVTLAPEAIVAEEAVERLTALWSQRMRWAEGSLRRLMEHGPRLLAGQLPLGGKLDFLAFVGEFVIPPLFAASVVASALTVPLPQDTDFSVPISLFLAYGVGTWLLGLAGLAAHGKRGLALIGESARGALFLSHWLLVVPAALVRIALAAPTRDFSKTPRYAPPAQR